MAQINKATDHFNTLIWTGDGASPKSITGVGFQPDLIWTKVRYDPSTTWGHRIWDSVRGVGTGKVLSSSSSNYEGQNGDPYGYISAIGSDGFTGTAGGDATWPIGVLNHSGNTYVAWNWLAGGTASSNTDGSITSTVSANTTSGFSIVSWTGTGATGTIGHGLGTTPSMIIIKNRSSAYDWTVGHNSLGWSNVIFLNLTNASQADTQFNNTAPTSSVFSIGTPLMANKSGDSIIAYCFSEKKGFSKFSSYVGNGSSDGTFVYTGFRPAFVLIKRTNSSIHDWVLIDSKRVGYNADNNTLLPNSSAAEDTGNRIDILSNGFKNYNANGSENESGGTYIYMAFAESPLVGTNNIPATAR